MPCKHSCIYEGWVWHRRRLAIEHRFRYRLFMMYLDLAELADVFRGRWLWSTDRPAWAWFRREDHFGPPDQPLDESVRDAIEDSGLARPVGAVRLLTHVRYMGYIFNPISLFYAFHADGKLGGVVAEVHNTPWRERHCYVLDPNDFHPRDDRSMQDKAFHVSPFLPMDLKYRWHVREPGASLAARIRCFREGTYCFEAGLAMRRREISAVRLRACLLRYPLMTQWVWTAIYWQAARLWWKGAPYFPHPRSTPAAANQVLR